MRADRKRNSGFGRGRWAVERQRSHISGREPPPEFENVESIGSAIGRLMGNAEMKTSSWLEELHSCWDVLVGESVARHARPGRMDGSRLIVFVDSSVWLNELSRYWKAVIVSNLQKKFGKEKIRTISLRLDPDGMQDGR